MSDQPASDDETIRNTFARYCQAIDDRSADDLAELFSEDGIWITPGATHQGRDEIRGRVLSLDAPLAHRQVKHITVNSVIEVAGDRASAVSDFIVVQQRSAGGVVLRVGRYHDRLVRTSGRWLVAERRHDSAVWDDA